MPAREEGAERLAGRPAEGQVDRAVGQALAAVAAGDHRAQHRADGAVDVAHRQLEAHRPRVEQRALAELDQRLVQRDVQAVVLRP